MRCGSAGWRPHKSSCCQGRLCLQVHHWHLSLRHKKLSLSQETGHLVHLAQCNGETNSWSTSETEEIDVLFESHSRLLHGAWSPSANGEAWILESFTDALVFESSAPEINQLRHSSSLWMLCHGSSTTQRVVSFSSCFWSIALSLWQVQRWSISSLQIPQQRDSWHSDKVFDAPNTFLESYCGFRKWCSLEGPFWSRCQRFGIWQT